MKRRFYVWSDKAIVKYNYRRDKEILLLRKINKKVQKNSLQTIFYLILYISGLYGSLAQLGEHLPYKQRVIGSSPITSTSLREWLSGRALPCQGKRREFESRLPLQVTLLLYAAYIETDGTIAKW